MELLLIRHGESTAAGKKTAQDDHDRILTPVGVAKSKRAGLALKKLEVKFSAMVTSPFPRAVETARLICEGVGHRPAIRSVETIGATADGKALMKEIKRNSELGALAVCAHEPGLSALTDILFGHDNRRPCLIFHTGAIAYMQLDASSRTPAATLHWFLDSRQLDLIAQGC